MSTLPSWIVDLNSPPPRTRLQRKSFREAGLNESDLDKLVIDQRDLLADVLIENDLIDEGAIPSGSTTHRRRDRDFQA